MSSSNNGTASVECLTEVFRCFICMEKLRDARLCPHCSKLCCYPCIRRWLTDQHQHCPHCRAPLRLHDLVNCRWAEEVTTQLTSLKINETIKQKRDEKDQCELHREKLSVYCSSCAQCICHQCALFNGSHAGHHFLPLDDVYKTNMSVINEHLGQLKHRHVEFICLIQDIERNVENIKTVKDERFREIRNMMHVMQIKLDEQFKIKLDTLEGQRVQLMREAEKIEHTLHNIEHRISTTAKAEVINRQDELLQSVQTICRKPMTNFVITPVYCDIPSEIIPPYHSGTFVIKHFSILQQNVDPIYSQPLHINGLTWRLKVYPYGNGTVRGSYLSVFLELTNGLNEPSKYEYRVEMVHQLSKDPTKNIIREFASDFEVGECWGYNRFFLLDALMSEGFLDRNKDTLVLRFQVRPSTYHQKSRDQQWYIKHLENNNQQLHNEMTNLREQIVTLTAKQILNDDRRDSSETIEVDNDEEYTSIGSGQINSDEDDNNQIEDDSPAENHQQSNEIPTVRSAIVKTIPIASQLVSDDSDAEIQAAFDGWRNHSRSLNDTLPFAADEDFILADVSEHHTNDNEENTATYYFPENQPALFRPITPNNPTECATNSNEVFPYHSPPQYHQTGNISLLIFNKPQNPIP